MKKKVMLRLRNIHGFFLVFGFGLGLILTFVFILPFIFILNLFSKSKYRYMQWVNKNLFSLLIFAARMIKVIKVNSIKGDCYSGPCIIISNHPGYFDVVFLISLISDMCVLVNRSVLYKTPFAPLIKMSGYVFSPGWRKTPYQSISKCMDRLNAGFKFMLFPEGTRSPENELRKFKYGAFKLAEIMELPIQLVLINTDPAFLPKGKRLYQMPEKTSQVSIEFFGLIDPPARGTYKEVARSVEQTYRERLGLISKK